MFSSSRNRLITGTLLLLSSGAVAQDPKFGAIQVNPFGLSPFSTNMTVTMGDLDDDGDIDMLQGEQNGVIYLRDNTGSSTAPAFGAAVPLAGIVGSTESPTLVDIDGDSDLDLFLGPRNILPVKLFINTGTPQVSAFSPVSLNLVGPWPNTTTKRLYPADIDGDGDVDFFIRAGSSINICRNSGDASTPKFGLPSFNPFGMNPGTQGNPGLGDMDGDGDLDLLLIGSGPSTRFLRNTGNSSAPAFAAGISSPFGLPTFPDVVDPEFVDLDGDRDLDLMIASSTGNMAFYRNTVAPDILAPASSASIALASTTDISVDVAFAAGDAATGSVSGLDFTELYVKTPGAVAFASTGLKKLGTSGTFSFSFSSGEGVYEFHTLATDHRGNTESAPATADDTILFTDTSPFLVNGIVSLDPIVTSSDSIGFEFELSESVQPLPDFSNIVPVGSLSTGAEVLMDEVAGLMKRRVTVRLADPAAEGTIGISLVGTLKDSVGNALVVPASSTLHTIIPSVAGDVNKDGGLDVSDVALLADANLSLVTLP